jgi:hypothetical protein
MKLGKLPATPDPRDYDGHFLLERAVAPGFSVPARFGHGTLLKEWGMLGNDSVGDCVFAGAAHETMLLSRIGSGPKAFFGPSAVLRDYSAVTGYDPRDPSSDQGTDVREALKYRVKTGILSDKPERTRHKIAAYARLSPGQWDELMKAVYLFGFVGIGVEFPQSAMEQFNDSEPWDVVPGSPIEGGHYIPVVGRSSSDVAGVLTWGKRISMTRRFYETYCDEAWVMLSSEDLKKSGRNERGLDYDTLYQALAAIH